MEFYLDGSSPSGKHIILYALYLKDSIIFRKRMNLLLIIHIKPASTTLVMDNIGMSVHHTE